MTCFISVIATAGRIKGYVTYNIHNTELESLSPALQKEKGSLHQRFLHGVFTLTKTRLSTSGLILITMILGLKLGFAQESVWGKFFDSKYGSVTDNGY